MNSENPVSNITFFLDVSADTLIDARKKLISLAPQHTILVMERVTSGGESKITESAPTFEEANRLIDRQLPPGAVVMNRNNNNIIKRAKLIVKAKNEAAAVLEGEPLAQVKLSTKKVSLVSTQIKEKGRSGFMGVGGEPNVYELEFASYASVTVKYRLPVTMKGLFALEGRIAQEAKQYVENFRDFNLVDQITEWLYYEAIIQPTVVLSVTQLSLIDSLLDHFREQRKKRLTEGGWEVTPDRVEKFTARLVELLKGDDPKKYYFLGKLLRTVDPTDADKRILQVCKACGHIWEDDGSNLDKCLLKCIRCGEKKNWGSHQWESVNEKVGCANCKRTAFSLGAYYGIHFCKDCGKYTFSKQGDLATFCSTCHQLLWKGIPDDFDGEDRYWFERTH